MHTVNADVARFSEDLRREDAAVVISPPNDEVLERVAFWERGQEMREEHRIRNGQTRQPDHIEGI